VLGGLGLAVGVLAACSTAHVDPGDWRAYHVLTLSWAAVGGLLLGGGTVLARRDGRTPWLPGAVVQAWTLAVGGLVVLLALRGGLVDPSGVWWSVGALAATAIL